MGRFRRRRQLSIPILASFAGEQSATGPGVETLGEADLQGTAGRDAGRLGPDANRLWTLTPLPATTTSVT
jgi:hypothetical protein